jgi:hypothetical protein
VDDVHLLDDTSAVLIHQMVTAGEAQLLATLRTGQMAPREVLDLWQRGELRRLDIGPFDRANAELVADAVLDHPLDAETHERLWNLARGNALYIRELLLAADQEGHVVTNGARARVTQLPLTAPRLADTVRARLGHLDPGAHTALVHLAFAEPCGPAELASVADAAMLAVLEQHELISVTYDDRRLSIRLAHPLYAEVLRAGTPLLQRQAGPPGRGRRGRGGPRGADQRGQDHLPRRRPGAVRTHRPARVRDDEQLRRRLGAGQLLLRRG